MKLKPALIATGVVLALTVGLSIPFLVKGNAIVLLCLVGVTMLSLLWITIYKGVK